MIQIQVFGDDNIHGRIINLPAVPRVGDYIAVDITYRVTRVAFVANQPTVVLWLETSMLQDGQTT